jgi:hypothetical protein
MSCFDVQILDPKINTIEIETCIGDQPASIDIITYDNISTVEINHCVALLPSEINDLITVQDILAGSGIIVNSNNGIYTISLSDPTIAATGIVDLLETVQDIIGNSGLLGSSYITINYNDSTGYTTISATGLQPSGNYSVVGHTHNSSDITNFNSSVSGLLPVKNISAGSGIGIVSSSGDFTVSVTGTFGLTGEQVDDRVSQLLVAGPYINLNYNDNLDTLTITATGLQPSGNYANAIHTHTINDITNFNSGVSGLLPGISGSEYITTLFTNNIYTIGVTGLQPSGNYSVVGHTHTSSNITDFNSSVSGLLPSVSGSGYVITSFANNLYTVSVTGLQPSGDYSVNGHSHIISDVSGLQNALDGVNDVVEVADYEALLSTVGTSGTIYVTLDDNKIYRYTSPSYSIQLGSDINGEAANDQSGYSVSLSSNGNILAIGAINNDGNGSNSGHVRVYFWNGSSWTQRGADINGEASNDNSGVSIDLSSDGNTLAIGATYNDGNGSNSGHVRVYTWNGSSWTQLGSDIDGEASNDFSGISVSLSSDGNTLAIGAAYNGGNGNNSGHVRVYVWNGSSWTQRGTDIDGEAANDNSGISVSLNTNGNILAIGASGNDSNTGHVRIYTWNGSSWIQRGADINGEAIYNYSGASISLNRDGNIVAIGATFNEDNGIASGHVRVYAWNGSSWIQRGTDIDGEASYDYSGFSVSLNNEGNILAIGADNNDGNGTNSGHVRVYYWDGNSWTQRVNDIDGEASGDYSGTSVSLSNDGNILAIGARFNSNSAGHVRIYNLVGPYVELSRYPSEHVHVSTDITDFNSSVGSLIPIQNITGVSGVQISASGTSRQISTNFIAGNGISFNYNNDESLTISTITNNGLISITNNSTTNLTIPSGYVIGSLSIYQNGVKLLDNIDYTATDGSGVTLLYPPTSGSYIEYLSPTTSIQNAGNYANAIHSHLSSDITNFNSSVSGLLPSVSGNEYITTSFLNNIYTISATGLQPSGNYANAIHSHLSSDISNFNSSVSGLLPTVSGSGYVTSSLINNSYIVSVTGLQPSGNYSTVGHSHTLSNITDASSIYDTSIYSLGTISGTVSINYGTDRMIQTFNIDTNPLTLNKGSGWPTTYISRDVLLIMNCINSTSITWNIVGDDWYNQPTTTLPSGEYMILLRAIGSGTIQGHYIGTKQGPL